LVELAKRNYRILLREAPGDWDARYNLERALWLAPESEQEFVDAEPPEKERSVSTLQGARMDLP
jgi:mxaK protein